MRRFNLASFGVGLLLIALAACGGGAGSGGGIMPSPPPTTSAPPTPTPGPPGSSTQTIATRPGGTVGLVGQFQPLEGDTATGGQGQPVDGTTCDPTMSGVYHVHAYVGLWVNGTQIAIPAGAGMVNPGPPDPTGFVNTASCFYHLHTHDSSGIVHIEDPDPRGVPITQSLYPLKNLFDEWGITVGPNQFGTFTGPVRVFTSGQIYRGGGSSVNVPATDLTFYGNDPTSVPLYSHEVIDIEVGPIFPSKLPNVTFYMEY